MNPGSPALRGNRALHDGKRQIETFCAAFQSAARRLGWAQFAERVERIAGGLAALGVTHGSAVALLLSERPEFRLVDTAAVHLGAAPFSIEETAPAERIAELCEAARTRVVVTEASFLDAVWAARSIAPVIERIVTIDSGDAFSTSLRELEDVREPEFDFDAVWRSVRPDDVLTLAVLPGAGGPPHIEPVTHARVLAACRRGVPNGVRHLGRRRFEHYARVIRAAEDAP